jgi:aspartate racemase
MAEYDLRPYAGRPILFVARDRGVEEDADPQFGWGGLASDGMEIHEVPGDHNTMFGEPHVQIMAQRLQACLDRAQAVARGEVAGPATEVAR